MSQETAPDQGLSAAGSTGTAPPKGLLQQMEELLAAVTADLAGLNEDLRAAERAPQEPWSNDDASV
ncbi:hypothetical protein ACFOSC_22590 [Streptantibioticus rubrisoli]|uniref:Uncharacterized protein n=1 Tax=Streptantibioticus rubrisoli TaxID=1387313 RepID=A0ABT1PKI2_9ACTN|nr:hypothetical protein [Streptantibioticus rubrisoli]MCQ4045875.1 hypothetical protein [Streptantibioticus rubrisoli]